MNLHAMAANVAAASAALQDQMVTDATDALVVARAKMHSSEAREAEHLQAWVALTMKLQRMMLATATGRQAAQFALAVVKGDGSRTPSSSDTASTGTVSSEYRLAVARAVLGTFIHKVTQVKSADRFTEDCGARSA